MKSLIYSFLLFLFTFFINISISFGQNESIDSLYNAIKNLEGKEKLEAYRDITQKMYSTPDSAFRIKVIHEYIAEAQKQKDVEYEARALNRQIHFFYVYHDINQFEKLYTDFMAFSRKNEFWKDYFEVFNYRIDILCDQNKFDEAIAETEKLVSFAKELNDPFSLGTINSCFGEIYAFMERYDEAEIYYAESISYFKKAKNLRSELNGYLDLLRVLEGQGKYLEMEKILPSLENVRQKRIVESGFESLTVRFYTHISHLEVYINLEQLEKAQNYANQIQEYIGELPERYLGDFYEDLMILYKAQKKYSQAFEVLESAYEYATKIDHQYNILYYLSEKVYLLSRLNRGDEAAETFEEYLKIRNTIEVEEINSKLDELRTQYEVDKHIAEKQRNRNYFLFSLGTCFLLVIALGIWIYYSRTIVLKNRALYRQIKEQDRLAEELEAVIKQYQQTDTVITPEVIEQQNNKEQDKEEQDKKEQEVIEKVILPNIRQRQLVSQLHEYLLKDRRFANFDIDIQNIVPEIATNRTTLFEAIKTVTGKTPMEFLNNLRLEEAKRLLDTSNLTIEVVAMDCGFNTQRTFYRQFREKYRITPAEYRRIGREIRN